ncbi:MAG: hypothetical protein IPH75_14155 [bacterium]|nr:hypothetical protein [bacterium]
MRTLLSLALIILVASAAMIVAQDAEKPWMDPVNCVFCKEVDAQPGLKDHMRHEYHPIHNGLVSISYIDKDWWDEFAAAQAAMQKVAGNMNPTNLPPMCQHCTKIGEFYMKGVKMEDIRSAEAVVVVYSHTDPTVVKEIQAWGARTTEELKKMNAKTN